MTKQKTWKAEKKKDYAKAMAKLIKPEEFDVALNVINEGGYFCLSA